MQKKPTFLTQIIIGALLVTIVIGATSLWVTSGARSAANKAANKVTEFYLREFAGRRSQMVSAAIDEEFEHMRRALQLVEPADLASQDALRAFIGKVETAYGTNQFAIVDEDDVVYARYATYSGGSRYDFLSNGALDGGDVISATNLYGANKQVCLAIPVSGLTFLGKDLKACFVQVDIESVIRGLALDAEENKTSFGLYYRNGENLTNLDFGPIGASENLLDALRDVLDVSTWNDLSKSFYDGKQDGIEFSYGGVRQTLYFAPVPETNWVLTALVSDDLIQDQMRSVGDEMIMRSTIQILVTGLALLAYFGAIVIKTRKTSEAMLAIERQNTKVAGERAEKSEQALSEVKQIAYTDALTGVKSKFAYTEKEAELDQAIREGSVSDLAVVVCDVNGLKYVNDTYGHAAGDEYLCAACKLICEMYDHSPVYRIGGDEFVILVQGDDYERREQIFAEFNKRVEENIAQGRAVVSAGMADFEPHDEQLYVVFHRADQRMYERKARLKELGARVRD
ncbi:MAG: GGDEF domain-containing protein [Atopobiaceae bacterium]|nr:GGDEF domain-containing protein [Atopobiaceae bacterium]